MAITSPGNVLSYQILVNGSPILDTYPIYSIHIEQEINRIALARITVLDSNSANVHFPISASATFVPGNDISIELGYDGTNSVVFKGIIVSQGLKIDQSSSPMLEVECKDKAIRMTVGRKNSAASNVKDSDFITTLIGNSSGLTAKVSATEIELPELVQYYVTDWDFMLARAEVNGLLVSTLNNTVNVFDPTVQTTSVATYTCDTNIFSFDGQINAISQLPQVTASGWDYQQQKIIQAQAATTVNGPGNLSSKTLSSVIGLSTFNLQTATAPSNNELAGWAKAQILKSELSKITAVLRVQGSSGVSIGNYLTLQGMGARFNGDYFVSRVLHEVANGNWATEYQLGMSPAWFVQEHEVQAPVAAGILPGIGGLYNATVVQIDSDPANEFRILVDVALFNDNGAGLWARLANFYSGNAAGVFFLPEIGDEVVVSFLNQDPRYPVILGSLYSQKNQPNSQFVPNANNSLKGITTKGQLQILFDDSAKTLTLVTPAKNTLVLDDKGQQIQLKDQNGNSIVMSSSGIAITSSKSISLEAQETIRIKGNSGITLASSAGDIGASGINISQSADAAFTAKGSESATIQGGAMMTLKAAMIMIN